MKKKRLRLICLAAVLGYLFLPPLIVNTVFAQHRQGDELGRTALCCSPLICTELRMPQVSGWGWAILAGIVVVALLILFLVTKEPPKPPPQEPPPEPLPPPPP